VGENVQVQRGDERYGTSRGKVVRGSISEEKKRSPDHDRKKETRSWMGQPVHGKLGRSGECIKGGVYDRRDTKGGGKSVISVRDTAEGAVGV